MIKILFYIDTLAGGGAEKVLCTLVNNMDQSRFDITVMTAFPENAEKHLVSGISYRSLYRSNDKVNRLLLRIEAALGLIYRIRIRGDYDIEVAYLECSPTKIMSASTCQKALKLAWVHCDLKRKASDPKRFAKKCAPWYNRFDRIVCVSEQAKESFCELFGNSPESVVMYNVNDELEIRQKAAAYAVARPVVPVLIAVGRLSHEKGIDRLLNACARLSGDGYDFQLWLVGDGPERQVLENFISERKLQKLVRFLGFQENPYPYMLAADALVCPSRFEGFSTVVTEALILGKPVVATECSGMRELLGDSEYGLITENSDQGIYEGLKRLLDDRLLLQHYAERASERGLTFSKERLLGATEAFFEAELRKKLEV